MTFSSNLHFVEKNCGHIRRVCYPLKQNTILIVVTTQEKKLAEALYGVKAEMIFHKIEKIYVHIYIFFFLSVFVKFAHKLEIFQFEFYDKIV